MQIETRKATRGDLSALVELYRRFLEGVAGERGASVYLSREAFGEPLDRQFGDILADDRRIAMLGMLDEVPVGLAVARIEQLADSSRHATVEALFVEPPAREVGVGEELLDSVVSWAAKSGAGGLDVPALPGMRKSKNFLEGSGFVARLLVMHRRIS